MLFQRATQHFQVVQPVVAEKNEPILSALSATLSHHIVVLNRAEKHAQTTKRPELTNQPTPRAPSPKQQIALCHPMANKEKKKKKKKKLQHVVPHCRQSEEQHHSCCRATRHQLLQATSIRSCCHVDYRCVTT